MPLDKYKSEGAFIHARVKHVAEEQSRPFYLYVQDYQ